MKDPPDNGFKYFELGTQNTHGKPKTVSLSASVFIYFLNINETPDFIKKKTGLSLTIDDRRLFLSCIACMGLYITMET